MLKQKLRFKRQKFSLHILCRQKLSGGTKLSQISRVMIVLWKYNHETLQFYIVLYYLSKTHENHVFCSFTKIYPSKISNPKMLTMHCIGQNVIVRLCTGVWYNRLMMCWSFVMKSIGNLIKITLPTVSSWKLIF